MDCNYEANEMEFKQIKIAQIGLNSMHSITKSPIKTQA